MMNSIGSAAKTLACKPQPLLIIHRPRRILSFPSLRSLRLCLSTSLSSSSCTTTSPSPGDAADEHDTKPTKIPSKSGSLGSGLYLVATPIGNLEDITLRALRVLKSADVILAEDTRHSGKLLQHYDIKTPLLSYHKFNESQREAAILRRLQEGQTVALISDAGTPGISDPGAELAKLCVVENIPVIPIPGPSALLAALSASGLLTNEFTFVGFLPKHAGSRREKLLVASNQTATQLFFVPPHKLQQFLSEALPIFGDSRICVIARELTKIHEEATAHTPDKGTSSLHPRRAIWTARPLTNSAPTRSGASVCPSLQQTGLLSNTTDLPYSGLPILVMDPNSEKNKLFWF